LKKIVKVVAAIIENEKGEILCALRSPQMSMPNMWEFPGGKVEERTFFIETTKEIFNDTIYEYEKFIINLISI
jgi:8-oxo-dGTP diphosphatase